MLKRRFDIEAAMLKAQAESKKAQDDFERARVENVAARSALASLKMGWGYEWVLTPGGNIGNIQAVAGGRLAVNGVGRDNGLVPVTNPAGGEVEPIVHVFAITDANTTRYIGEFKARLDSLQPAACTLEPTWTLMQNETAGWNFANGVRLRSQVPPGQRNAFSSLNQSIIRLFEQNYVTDIHIQNQTELNGKAQQALDLRKGELTGDPNGADVADHPEYRVGLVKAIKDLEEERNGIQNDVDGLRRGLKTATETRQSRLQAIRQQDGTAGTAGTAPQVSQAD
ncbi:MAG: hypothetical protein ACKPJJ_28165 [Planctomycetaceae bacterium]